jgi:hypothetical protein
MSMCAPARARKHPIDEGRPWQVVAKGLGKPDSYVAIQLNDKQVAMHAVRTRLWPRRLPA